MWLFWENYSDNDDEQTATFTEENNVTDADNNDNRNNEEEKRNFVTGDLVLDVESEDGSRDAKDKISCMNEKMEENTVAPCTLKAITPLVHMKEEHPNACK